MTERERIAARIRALLAKTVENGCTEDEAVAAAAKAAEMLERYNLTLDEVEMRASPFGRHAELHDDPVGERLWKPASAIAKLTGATFWTSRPGVFPVEINFFGFQHEVDVARYLLEICARAMRQQASRLHREYGLFVAAKRRRLVAPYLDGMADRLRERIIALQPPAPTGKGLIVLRDQLVKAEMSLRGIELGERRTRASRSWEQNYRDGRRAADAVGLNRGVTGASPDQRFLA